MKKLQIILFLIVNIYNINAQNYPIDLKLAKQYFDEAKELADIDNKELWGVYMYGPILIVDGETRFVVSNEIDAEGKLKAEGEVFIGQLSETDMVANTATKWAGKHWMMVLNNSLSKDRLKRMNLMMHELWHLIQTDIGMQSGGSNNGHLDEMQARIWLKMEWNALESAIFLNGKKRQKAVRDAINFRSYRHMLYPESKENECILEMNEGIAEYTGLVLSHLKKKEKQNYFKEILPLRKEAQTYVRSFAYVSGPLYGVLLDAKSKDWRNELNLTSDLAGILAKEYDVNHIETNDEEINKIARNYQFDEVYAIENAREEKRLEKMQELKEIFLEGQVLTLHFQKMSIQFNPTNLIPLEDYGTIYPTLRITDTWGIIDVTENALLGNKWDFLKVSAKSIEQNENIITGKGWTLQLNEGWKVICNEKGYELNDSSIK